MMVGKNKAMKALLNGGRSGKSYVGKRGKHAKNGGDAVKKRRSNKTRDEALRDHLDECVHSVHNTFVVPERKEFPIDVTTRPTEDDNKAAASVSNTMFNQRMIPRQLIQKTDLETTTTDLANLLSTTA